MTFGHHAFSQPLHSLPLPTAVRDDIVSQVLGMMGERFLGPRPLAVPYISEVPSR